MTNCGQGICKQIGQLFNSYSVSSARFDLSKVLEKGKVKPFAGGCRCRCKSVVVKYDRNLTFSLTCSIYYSSLNYYFGVKLDQMRIFEENNNKLVDLNESNILKRNLQ